MNKKNIIKYSSLIIVIITIFSCKGDADDGSGVSVHLESLYVAGNEVFIGEPAASLESAKAIDLILADTDVSNADIIPIANSDDARIAYGRMTQNDSAPIWRTTDSITFNDGDILAVRIRDNYESTVYYKFIIRVKISIEPVIIAGKNTELGNHAVSYKDITSPGSIYISNLIAGSIAIELPQNLTGSRSFRTAKVSGDGSPQWCDNLSPVYSCEDGDFLHIEIKSEVNGREIINIYKVVVTVYIEPLTVLISGDYTINTNSEIIKQRVAIEAYNEQTALTLISRTEADINNKTWTMYVPPEKELWFRVRVTDSTGYTFGRIVSESSEVFTEDTQDMNLTLGPFAQPEITNFELIGAHEIGGILIDKQGIINKEAGTITFENTISTTISVNTVLQFHNLAAKFTLSENSKLYAGNVEQVSGSSFNNYYKDVTFTVVAEDNARQTYTITGQVLDVKSSANGASNSTAVNRIVGTSSWQTQGFGVIIIDTIDRTLGLPVGTVTKLNTGVWNPTGTFTYISPTGEVISGGTDIRGRGNASLRNHEHKSYNLRLNTAEGFDYYDYKTEQYIKLPSHRRWALLAHQSDSSRIRTTLSWEIGRRVLTDMGWQPHGDWVFFFLNGEYKGMYIIAEIIKPEPGRHNITPLISASNPNGGFMVEINNNYFYFNEGSSNWTFDEMYSFMTSHQNPVRDRQQGVVWSMKEPDSNLGWFYADPPLGNGSLTFTNPAHAHFFPRKGILLMATLSAGTAYNRRSNSPAEWIVPNEIGQPNGIGTSGMRRTGTFNGNNGGIYGDRTLAQAYPGYESSTFVRIAQFLQDTEDAIYSHDWLERGYGNGSYLEYIDIGSFIDFQIASEILSDSEINVLNGRHAYYDPSMRRLRMGPIWDHDQSWIMGARDTYPGFIRKIPFWYKELLGWEITSSNAGTGINQGIDRPERADPYYADRLRARWNEVNNQFNTELDPYIDITDARFNRVTGFSEAGSTFIISRTGSRNNRLSFKNIIANMKNELDPIFNGY
ncbi:MAG: CotH kinase family protein [Treponema sp.]|nr:CotH kinase family protein [Treponema sp.]